MKYLTTCALLCCMAAANAETTPAANSSAASIQQATQSVARRITALLGLTTVSDSEQASISLKAVVLKALQEGKPMSEIRLATNQAVSEVTGKTVSTEGTSNKASQPEKLETQTTEQATGNTEIVANPAEVTLDPTSGKMIATVLPSESIFRLAQRVYGKENGRMYLKIFAANTDKIKDINVVVEGQQLIMP